MNRIPRLKFAAALGALLVTHAAQASVPASAAIVGEATLVIGTANRIGDDGQPRPVQRGDTVRVGDRIETQAGGHVHLRFVDGGRVSVRPSSRLHIESYSHEPSQPHLGAIKFRLDEGAVRSITGTWGEAARERFRLNTPVAAIGVKGTDFIVRSDANSTLASVYAGAITVTPLANGCTQTLGPCINGKEQLLTADMKGQMLELDLRQHTTANVVPAFNQLARSQASRSAAPEATASAAVADKTLALDTAPGDAAAPRALVNESRAATVVASAPADMPAPVVVPPVAPPVVAERPVTPPLPEPPAVVLPPQVNQLAWVRYGWTPKSDLDNFSFQFEQAAAAGLERAWGNASYAAYRLPSAPGQVLAPADASATFRLANAAAQITLARNGRSESVAVGDGSLMIDFARATFATSLGLSSASIGQDVINATGTVASNGVLRSSQGNATLGGTVTLDGREAGYAFQKTYPQGALTGITLWGR